MTRLLWGAMACGLVLALAAQPASAADSEAGERFEKGVSLFKNGDFVGALVEFKAAYEVKPHFSVRYNLGITLYKLHRYVEAEEEFLAYLEEGADQVDPDRKAEVEGMLAEIDTLISTVQISCGVPEARLFIDGVQSEQWSVRLDVGEYRFEIRAPGYEPWVKVMQVPSGKAIVLEASLVPVEAGPAGEPVSPAPAPDRKKLAPAPFYALLAFTVASGIGAAVTGGLVLKKNAEYEDMTRADEDWNDVRLAGKKLALATDVLLGITGALAVTTVVLAVMTDFSRKEKAVQAAHLFPVIGPLSLGMGGVF